MKPVTAAAKLGIYLPAAPEQFRESPITRAELDALRAENEALRERLAAIERALGAAGQ